MDISVIEERVAGQFAAKKEVPQAFKDQWKNKDKDNDGKENEPKPDFLKDKEKKSSESPVVQGVVAALTDEGKVELFNAPTPKVASAMKAALKAKGGYSRVASGPNADGLTADELYTHFEERWASSLDRTAGCEKLPEGGMRENCEKKSKGGDGDKKDDKKDSKSDDKKDGKMPADLLDKFKKKKSSDEVAPEGVVAALTTDGKIEVFSAETPKAATAMKAALKAKGGYSRVASGPNPDGRTASELYEMFEQRWATDDNDADDEDGDDDDDKKLIATAKLLLASPREPVAGGMTYRAFKQKLDKVYADAGSLLGSQEGSEYEGWAISDEALNRIGSKHFGSDWPSIMEMLGETGLYEDFTES